MKGLRYGRRNGIRMTSGYVAGKACVSIALTCVLGFTDATRAQSQLPAKEDQIKVVVELLDPKDVTHQTGAAYRSGIKIEVTDGQLRPLPGASVVVALSHAQGVAGAELAHGERTAELKLDPQGIGTITALRANRVRGDFTITATASFGGETGSAEVTQTNTRPPLVTTKRLLILGGICAAILVPVLTLRKTPPPSVTITSGGSAGPVGHP
jgi:hypothetical protein